MDMRIPPLDFKIMLESNPLKSTMLVGRLGVFVDIFVTVDLCSSCLHVLFMFAFLFRGLCPRFRLCVSSCDCVFYVIICLIVLFYVVCLFVCSALCFSGARKRCPGQGLRENVLRNAERL